jgi:hypothetical protein
MAAPFLFLARTLEATTTSIPHVRDLTTHEALSGIFGSISLATWIFLLVPQLILNYKTGSAEGISLAFLTVWLVGDVASLAGTSYVVPFLPFLHRPSSFVSLNSRFVIS